MTRSLSPFLIVLALGSAASSEESAAPQSDPPGQAQGVAPGKKPAKKNPYAPEWDWHVTLEIVSDSNIEQNEDEIHSTGYIGELGVEFSQRLPTGDFQFSYDVARHSYTNTETWDRTTHTIETALEHRLGRQWVAETVGEIRLKDASNDGDIRDEYELAQRLEYRFARDWRARLEGALRFKRNSVDDEGKDARDPFVGVRLERRFQGGNVRLGYGEDHNKAKDERRSYRRDTWTASATRDFGKRDNLTVEAEWEDRVYSERLVGSPGGAVPRNDKITEVQAEWEHAIRDDLEIAVTYGIQNRRSNDDRREYDDSLVGASLTYRW